ncbi:hypothetical protein Syn7502_01364 [Synechococcus sp. PCC 7502]|nr:hypothetical protein Syn7502_01364 [Synechococcus sp. PCC 7502]
MGVWIAGFFGSGKSYFLKILAYLLENRLIDHKHAIDFFDSDRIADPLLRANIQRSVNISADVILFNIDSKSDASGKTQKDSIVKVFQKVFDEKLGYFGAVPAIAEFERQLDQKGSYIPFKNAFQSIHGKSWEAERDAWGFCQENIAEALHMSLGMGKDEANRLIDRFNQQIALTPEKFAQTVKSYLDRQGKQHQVLFMVDEVGQYIGENSDLMLNLQTVVEDLGVYCHGRAWVVVTSQEAMDEITKNRLKGNDFSKIVGRFGRPLSLSSANTDDVIRLRLLVKTDVAGVYLKGLYAQKEAILKNQIAFSQDCAELPGYRSAEEFASTYPFIPYQFTLLQKVFEQIRVIGAAGKHLAMGERSLLDAFQIAAKSFAEHEIGILVPFQRFYDAIEGFLDTSVKRAIAQAEENSQLQQGDLDLLKTLFMVKYIKEIRANLDNLTTLSLSSIDQDKLALRDRVQASLERLEKQTLIQRAEDLYVFLTQEEQDIGREIKNTPINPSDVTEELQKLVWGSIFTDKKYKYDARHQYDFNKKLDDHGHQVNDISLHIVTPYADRYRELQADETCLMATGSGQEVLVRLPDDPRLIDEANELVQTAEYIRTKNTRNLSASIQRILSDRSDLNSKRKDRLTSLMRSLIAEADVFACGSKVQVTSREARTVLNDGMRYLVENVYTKLGYIQSGFDDEAGITNALISDIEVQDLSGNHANAAAHSDIQLYLADEARSHRRVSIRNVRDKFAGRPYGWAELDTLGAIAELVNKGKVELRRAQEIVNTREKGLVAKLRLKSGLDEYLVRLTEEVDPTSFKIARDLANELLETAPPTDFQKLREEYIKAFNAQIQKLQGWLTVAERDSLPFIDKLRSHIELLGKLQNTDGVAIFFKAIKGDREALETYIDDRDKLTSFFTSQLVIFQKAIAELKTLEPDLQHIKEDTLLARVETVKQILAMPDPTGRIPELMMLLKPIQDKVREILQAQVNQVQQQSLRLREKVQEYVTQAHGDVYDRLNLSTLDVDINRIVVTANQSSTIDSAIARQSELSGLYNVLVSRLDAEAITIQTAQQQEMGNSVTLPVVPVVKPIAVIKTTRSISKPILETEADVKEYLQALGREIMKKIKQGKRVRLE